MAMRMDRFPGIALAMILTLGLQLVSPGWALGAGQAPAVTVAPEAAPGPDAARTLITLSADNTPVVEILQILASRTGLNIATSADVEKRLISLRMRETPFEEALNLVCRTAGLGYERVGNSILVADPKSLDAQTGLTSRVFDLHYASAVDVAKVLEVIAPGVKADVHSNRVVVRAPQSAVEQAARTVADMDRKPAQVLLEARLIEINTTRLSELGIDWEKLTKWTGVFSEGNPGSSAPGNLPSDAGYLKVGDGDTWFRQRQAYEVAIDALITDGSARLLANSKVVTLDGQPAEIFAGETVPVVITSLQSPGGGGGVFQTVQLEKIDVGVRLNITPRIGLDNLITTLVEPEVSRIVAFVGPDNDLPQTTSRRAKTLVRVRNGQKIYLGGLLTEEKRSTVKSVPLLGQLPIVGALFRHHREESVRLDLLIEITPRIIGDEGGETTLREQQVPDAESEWRALEKLRKPAGATTQTPAR
jgi:type II secretory pathway component GspD/PulD (secretin)